MALHRIGEARQALHAAIVGVLDDGRVSAYPRREDVGPAVWIDTPTVTVNGRAIDVDFPIHCVYDGSDEAQVAGLDDLVSRVWDACERLANTTPLRSQPGQDRVVAGQSMRRQIVTVRRGVAARTLCLPDAPGVSPIPPDQAQE